MKFVKSTLYVVVLILVLSATQHHVYAQLNIKEISRRASPAVVTILSLDQNNTPIGLGSGFIVKHNGLIVSNYHVIKNAFRVAVKTKSGDEYWVNGVVDLDAHRDFVILKIAGYGLPAVNLGNSNIAEIGDEIIAIGNPEGLKHTVSNGIISQMRQYEGYSLFQITAPISQGSSGGPLINKYGQVIGITTSTILKGQNLNFALPINYVRAILETNTSVQYTLSEIAIAQAKIYEEELNKRINELFTLYEDPDGYFSFVYPRDWKLERSSGWDEDGTTYYKRTMMAPKDAYRADVDGYLSEGIRFRFRLPPKDKVWTMDSVIDWAPYFKEEMLQAHPGFALTDSKKVNFGKHSAIVYSFVGENEQILEPEKTTFILLAGGKYRLIIELVSPTSKLKFYDTIYLALIETLKLSEQLTSE